MDQPNYVIPFEKLTIDDIGIVGEKNASLGEMIQALSPKGVRIPPGFAVSAQACRAFLDHNNLVPVITGLLKERKGGMPLSVMGAAIRTAIAAGSYPQTLKDQISEAYSVLSAQHNEKAVDVAVRSSATAGDLPAVRVF